MPTAPAPHFCTVPPPVPAGHLVWSAWAAWPHNPLVPPTTSFQPRL